MKPAGRRQKGSRVERELVARHLECGIPAKRVPLSGAQAGWKGDIRVGEYLVAEVKARANGEGFATLEKWLGDNALLFLKRDRRQPMVVVEWETYLRLVKAWLVERGELCSPEHASES
jgi:Holliday junction resolvase